MTSRSRSNMRANYNNAEFDGFGNDGGTADKQQSEEPPSTSMDDHQRRASSSSFWAMENHDSYVNQECKELKDPEAYWKISLHAEDILKLPFASRAMCAAIHQCGPERFRSQMQMLYETIAIVTGLLVFAVEGNGIGDDSNFEEPYGVLSAVSVLLGIGAILFSVMVQVNIGFFADDEIVLYVEKFGLILFVPIALFFLDLFLCTSCVIFRFYIIYGSTSLWASIALGGFGAFVLLGFHLKLDMFMRKLREDRIAYHLKLHPKKKEPDLPASADTP